MVFIELTLVNKAKILINAHTIRYMLLIEHAENDNETKIVFERDNFIYVKETPEHILSIINYKEYNSGVKHV